MTDLPFSPSQNEWTQQFLGFPRQAVEVNYHRSFLWVVEVELGPFPLTSRSNDFAV